MRRLLIAMCFSCILFANNIDSTQNTASKVQNQPKTTLPQKPLIVEYNVFKMAQEHCNGSVSNISSDSNIKCLVDYLRPFNNKICTKVSGSKAKFGIVFYALDSNANITYPRNINNRFCEFRDTLGGQYFSRLKGDGFSYIIEYPFSASSSYNNAYISCGFMHYKTQVFQTSQPISVIPHRLDINFHINNATNNIIDINNASHLTLKAQNNPLLISQNATARTINGEVDRGFGENLTPLYIKFNNDNGLCKSIVGNVNGIAKFQNGRLFSNNLYISFDDVASGELEIALTNRLLENTKDKCVTFNEEIYPNKNEINFQNPLIIKKHVEVLPHSFYATLENNGRLLYYNQHTFIPAIPYLPLAKISLQALNEKNQPILNFTKDCYGKDLSIKLEDNNENFVFINENMPDSTISKETFIETSLSRVVRKISVRGIKDRDLTPIDLFSSKVINLNDTFLQIDFISTNDALNYPRYTIKPHIKNDWRIALMRGRISLIPNTNENQSLIANPKIAYEFYCKYPTCKIVDIESVISPHTRLPKASANDWFINTAHWRDLKVLENNIISSENISVFSLGDVKNGIQTLALQSTQKGRFNVKISQGYQINDFAQFLYFSPSFNNIREDLGVSIDVNFSEGSK